MKRVRRFFDRHSAPTRGTLALGSIAVLGTLALHFGTAEVGRQQQPLPATDAEAAPTGRLPSAASPRSSPLTDEAPPPDTACQVHRAPSRYAVTLVGASSTQGGLKPTFMTPGAIKDVIF